MIVSLQVFTKHMVKISSSVAKIRPQLQRIITYKSVSVIYVTHKYSSMLASRHAADQAPAFPQPLHVLCEDDIIGTRLQQCIKTA